jgi:hypothetical protein
MTRDQERALALLQFAHEWDGQYTDRTQDEIGWRSTKQLSSWGCGKETETTLDDLLDLGLIDAKTATHYGNTYTAYRAI